MKKMLIILLTAICVPMLPAFVPPADAEDRTPTPIPAAIKPDGHQTAGQAAAADNRAKDVVADKNKPVHVTHFDKDGRPLPPPGETYEYDEEGRVTGSKKYKATPPEKKQKSKYSNYM